MKKDIGNRQDIELLVDEFYKKVVKDDLIGHYFLLCYRCFNLTMMCVEKCIGICVIDRRTNHTALAVTRNNITKNTTTSSEELYSKVSLTNGVRFRIDNIFQPCFLIVRRLFMLSNCLAYSEVKKV